MPSHPHPLRPAPLHLGREAECLAAERYVRLGFTVVDQNARLGPLELDLVMANRTWLVFVEVRARSDLRFGHPAATVDGRKQGRLRVAAARWLSLHPEWAGRRIRFDVVGVIGRGRGATLTVFENAF